MKKLLSLIIISCLIFSVLAAPVAAASQSANPAAVRMILDGKETAFKYPPFVSGKQVYLYVPDLLAYYGYDRYLKDIGLCYKGDDKGNIFEYYQFTANSSKVRYISNTSNKQKDYVLDAKVMNDKSGNCFVPVSFISKVMSGKYTYDSNKKILSITSNRKAPAPTTGTATAKASAYTVLDGFTVYEADGFRIQVPKDWLRGFSEVLFNRSETHNLIYKNDIVYKTSIEISQYDKNTDYETFAKNSIGGLIDKLDKTTVKNADAAYLYKESTDSITSSYVYAVVAFKGDLCYTFRASQGRIDTSFLGPAFIDSYTRDIKKFKSDVDKMVPTFELSKDKTSFAAIISNTTASKSFNDVEKNIVRDGKTPLDEKGNLIHKGDTVKCGGFYGSVLDINGTKVLIYWDSKSIWVPDKDIDYWAAIAGIRYKASQWMEAKDVEIDSSGYQSK